MSPKRRPRCDDLWDRTPGGLIVPRRPTLPTRRFIQKMGTAKDCCGGVCSLCSDLNAEYDITLTGFSDGTVATGPLGCGNGAFTGCSCLNGTFRVSGGTYTAPTVTNWECDGAWYGGCSWESGLVMDGECEVSVDYETCDDISQGFYIYLYVKNGSSAGTIDIKAMVTFQYQNHSFIEFSVPCASIDGLVLSACGSSILTTRMAAGCAASGLTGTATIDAVA